MGGCSTYDGRDIRNTYSYIPLFLYYLKVSTLSLDTLEENSLRQSSSLSHNYEYWNGVVA